MVLILAPEIRVVDGDTVAFKSEYRVISSRCRFIDCPPVNSLWGLKAKEFVEELFKVNQFYYEDCGFDRYGRLFADWFVGGRDVNVQVELVRNGLAIDALPKVRYNLPKRSVLLCCDILNAQYEAFSGRVGFWGDDEFVLWNRARKLG